MVELRKRKAPASAPVAEKKSKPTPKPEGDKSTNQSAAQVFPQVSETIDLENFGGEVETNDGTRTTVKALVDESTSGVILFTYPKASTPGCTKQACLFRDNYAHLTSTGLSIYGLSADSPKANTTFKSKQNLPYPLLCDPSAATIAAIGFKKAPKGTARGVFAVNKSGKILIRELGGPEATVNAVQALVARQHTA